MPTRSAFLAALAVTAAFVVCAPAAGASTFPTWTPPTAWTTPTWLNGTAGDGVAPVGGGAVAGPCGRPTAGQGQGGSGTVSTQVCQGAGLTFIGPAIGEIASVVGPTIIGPAFVGNSIVSAGNVAVGP
jgi:hypothetical protein